MAIAIATVCARAMGIAVKTDVNFVPTSDLALREVHSTGVERFDSLTSESQK